MIGSVSDSGGEEVRGQPSNEAWHAPLARHVSDRLVTPLRESASRQLQPVSKAWYTLPFCWLLLWLLGIIIIVVLSFTIFVMIPGCCAIPVPIWTGFVMRISGVDSTNPDKKWKPPDPAAGSAVGRHSAAAVALLFWLVFGVVGNVGAYGMSVVAQNEVFELSSVRRSLGVLIVAQFLLLTVTMEIAGRFGIFSIRRLPRGRPQLYVAAIGVWAFGLELLSLRLNGIVVSQMLRLLQPMGTSLVRGGTGLPIRHRSRRFRVAMVFGTVGVLTAAFSAPCGSSEWGTAGFGAMGRGWAAGSTVRGGVLTGVAAVGASALYSCGIAVQQHQHAVSAVQCTHSFSRDQFLMTAAAALCMEVLQHGFPGMFGRPVLQDPPELITEDGKGGYVVVVHSLFLWTGAAAGAMWGAHVCALYPMRARVSRLVEQARPCVTIILGYAFWAHTGWGSCATTMQRHVWGGGSPGATAAAVGPEGEGFISTDAWASTDAVHLSASALAILAAFLHATLPPPTAEKVMKSHFASPDAQRARNHASAFQTMDSVMMGTVATNGSTRATAYDVESEAADGDNRDAVGEVDGAEAGVAAFGQDAGGNVSASNGSVGEASLRELARHHDRAFGRGGLGSIGEQISPNHGELFLSASDIDDRKYEKSDSGQMSARGIIDAIGSGGAIASPTRRHSVATVAHLSVGGGTH